MLKQRMTCVFATLTLFVSIAALANSSSLISLVDQGRFRDAEALIQKSLSASNLKASERSGLEFERERMRRMRIDFKLTKAEAIERVRKQIPDLKDAEFEAWDAAGLLERMTIDGDTRYFSRAPSNLFRLSAEARARRAEQTPFNDGPFEKPHEHHREILAAAKQTGKTSVAQRQVRITQSISVNADVVPAGETLRVWIPYPRSRPGQHENIRLISSTPAKHTIAPESTLQRTVYLEAPARAGKPTEFNITYELTNYAQHWTIDPAKVTNTPALPELREHLGERPPHIVFTPAIREFSKRILGDERNPYRVAMKLFDAVDRIPWAGAREYSTISNISDYALHAGHADCGQQTLLLMTLLRLNGIPARWQSGWIFADGEYNNMHDWGWMYLAPYGWVPMDVTTGRLGTSDPAVDTFYFGALDAYRLAFNDDYSQPLVPPKQHFRSETVDSQRGEVEWRGGNLYFDQWDYDFKATVLNRGQSSFPTPQKTGTAPAATVR
ncbi:MAG TPA: transglutaminase-like domain-containing protein [Steroidobacteraceae bacterium]|nr:transglutaminase-like domain-containing protein [Steroidobacteraceae bacterium]